MANPYGQGYAQALADIGDSFAALADQAQAEINQAVLACQSARAIADSDAEDDASRALADAMRRKIGFLHAVRIVTTAEARHATQTKAA